MVWLIDKKELNSKYSKINKFTFNLIKANGPLISVYSQDLLLKKLYKSLWLLVTSKQLITSLRVFLKTPLSFIIPCLHNWLLKILIRFLNSLIKPLNLMISTLYNHSSCKYKMIKQLMKMLNNTCISRVEECNKVLAINSIIRP